MPADDWAAHSLHLLNQPQPKPQAPPVPNPARLRLALMPALPQSFASFATGLIAPKPVKPCDRAVFGALNSLLLLQWNRHRLLIGFGSATRKRPATTPCQHLRICPRCPPTCPPPMQAPKCRSASESATPACLPAGPPQNIARFATGLIAPKPEKPCDGAIFRALNSLLFLQRSQGAAGRLLSGHPLENSPQPFHSAPLRLPCRHACRRCKRPNAEPALNPSRLLAQQPPKHRLIRYRFDSSQARQTVRQGRFQGLGFAPVFAAKP